MYVILRQSFNQTSKVVDRYLLHTRAAVEAQS